MPKRTGTPATIGNGNGKRHATQQSVNAASQIHLRHHAPSPIAPARCKYVPELTWILFLRILDEREAQEAEEAEALGIRFTPIHQKALPLARLGRPGLRPAPGRKGQGLEVRPRGSAAAPEKSEGQARRQRPAKSHQRNHVRVDRSRIDSEKNFLDVLDKVHEISNAAVDTTHVFTLSQVYEGLLLKMGEKGNDGGQFFTPREVIRAMVRVVDPKTGKTVYDPGCGTGGFLAQVLRVHEGRRRSVQAYSPAPAGNPQAPDVLRPRERQHHLPHRAGQPRPARH